MRSNQQTERNLGNRTSRPFLCRESLIRVLLGLLSVLALGTTLAHGTVTDLIRLAVAESSGALVATIVTTGPLWYRMLELSGFHPFRVAASTEGHKGNGLRVLAGQFQNREAVARMLLDFLRSAPFELQRKDPNMRIARVWHDPATISRAKTDEAGPTRGPLIGGPIASRPPAESGALNTPSTPSIVAASRLDSPPVLPGPILMASLQPPAESVKTAPRGGYDNVDGVWVDYEYRYSLGVLAGTLYTKFGTTTGLLPLNTLTYTFQNFNATLTVGRTQDKDLNVYDQAEVSVALSSRSPEQSTLSMSFSISDGWFREVVSRVDTTRFTYVVGLDMHQLPLGSSFFWDASASWTDAFYGTGARQGVLQIDAGITDQLDASSSIRLAYDRLSVFGASPFVFDTIESDKVSQDLSLTYSRTGVRGGEVETAYTYGVSYSFLDQSISFDWEYRERAPDRFHWGIKAEHDLATGALKLTTDSGLALGWGTEFTVQATDFKTDTGTFKDLDYILTWRVECVDYQLKYRQVQGEIWFQVDPRRCDP